ncbi:hypothetical protein AURDEDRAFT_173221 [Auricularia subglabra TFB-10046 SS5]|uniref:Uncharacterized protein n=1 Tax=Auricularia subglabra (strain TFB-10046 / SS5) TaxID=717982 RepID=J0LHT3_AURST|nr:hypothetical protein AURDEDRAFT_173221 [Auricularia subglabra TFB-10046 SS5]
MFFAAPLALFVALASSVIAAPSAEKSPEAPVAAAAIPQRLRTTSVGVNGTLNNLKARGIRIQFGETTASEVVWAAGDKIVP